MFAKVVLVVFTLILALSICLNITLAKIIYKLKDKIRSLQPKYKLTKKQFDKLDYNCIDLKLLDSLNGIQFENLCCEMLHEFGYEHICKTNVTGDFGLDIICLKDGKKYGIQCKCYSSSVGISAVQEAFAGGHYYGCDEFVVMTNQYFTDAAQELARTIGVTLWSRHFFVREIGNLQKRKRYGLGYHMK